MITRQKKSLDINNFDPFKGLREFMPQGQEPTPHLGLVKPSSFIKGRGKGF